jgi:hypothetical protein
VTLRLGLQAASFTSGLATVPTKTGRFTVIVLPKPWRLGTEQTVGVEWTGGDQRLVLHENDRATLHGVPDADFERLDELLSRCSAESNDDGLDEDDPTRQRRRLLSRADPDQSAPLVDTSASFDGAIIDLLLLFRRTPVGRADAVGRTRSRLLAPLLHALFVEEVRSRLSWIRRGYVEQTEHLGTVRGRVEARSLGPALVGRIPRIECTYDTFTDHTPLVRVLTTALEVVSQGSWLRSVYDKTARRLSGGDRPAWEEARSIRTVLADVPAYPISQAQSVARRLYLPPAEARIWGGALQLARDVLELRGPDWRPLHQDPSPRVWPMSTASAWESILLKSLQLAGFEARGQVEVAPPWDLPGKRHADLLVRDSGRCWLLDAKYSLRDGVPSAAHLSQVYAYSRIGQKGRPRPTDTGLLYVTDGAEVPAAIPRRARPLPVRDALNWSSPLPLHVLSVSFPGRSAVQSEARYDRWCEGLGQELRKGLERSPADFLPPEVRQRLTWSVFGSVRETAGHADT